MEKEIIWAPNMAEDIKIVVLNGSGRSGKDTVAIYANRMFEVYSDLIVHNISTVDLIKDVARIMGWGGQKDDKSRTFLSDLKDLWSDYCNGPFWYIVNYINKLDQKKKHLVFVHIREPKEIQKIIDAYPTANTVLVTRKGTEDFTNHADQEVNKFTYDFSIKNDGTLDEFYTKINQTLRYII